MLFAELTTKLLAATTAMLLSPSSERKVAFSNNVVVSTSPSMAVHPAIQILAYNSSDCTAQLLQKTAYVTDKCNSFGEGSHGFSQLISCKSDTDCTMQRVYLFFLNCSEVFSIVPHLIFSSH